MQNSKLNILHYKEVDSTNALANSYLKGESEVGWTLFSTDSQLAGRGQRGTTWQDEPGKNVLMSLLSPSISWPINRIFDLNITVSLAIQSVLSEWVTVDLKWPNDIYVNGRKLGGILIEPSLRGAYVQRLVVGLGINVFQQVWEEGIRATSISLESENPPATAFLIEKLGNELLTEIEQLLSTGKLDKQAYLEACIGYNKLSRYSDESGEFEGTFVDVDSRGRQVIAHQNGITRAYDLKEIKLILEE